MMRQETAGIFMNRHEDDLCFIPRKDRHPSCLIYHLFLRYILFFLYRAVFSIFSQFQASFLY